MSININGKYITLNTEGATYQMAVNEGLLTHLYFGEKLDDSTADINAQVGFHSFSPFPYDLDEKALSHDLLPLEYSASGSGEFRTPALTVTFADGSSACDLRFKNAKILSEKPVLSGLPASFDNENISETLEIELCDTVFDLRVFLLYSVFPKYDIITRSVRVVNQTGEDVFLSSVQSANLDFTDNDFDFINFYGRHIGERSLCRTHLEHNKISCESMRGSSSHQQNPFVIVCRPNCGEKSGFCIGNALVYSGNFEASIESTQIDTARLVMGINRNGFRYKLSDGEEFTAPEIVQAISFEGFGRMSRNYHRFIRNHITKGIRSRQMRPVLINNWEATYFKFNAEKLVKIAENAKRIGVDTFVLDDGWFGGRNNDRSSLGDWFVDEEKLGCSLKKLISDINALGLKFGLWFEPECISENSDLFRNHPEFCLKTPNRKGSLSRHQWVINMADPKAVDCIFEMMKNILDENPIDYVKWDFNRHLTDVYSSALPADRQGEVYHRYVLGVYDLLERLCNRYPNLLIEGCSGGGGRFDLGMLYYSPQIWTSDNTDPICRLDIQYGTSFCYPISSMGSHVTASPNHQTRRPTPLKTRSSVAMAGSYGFELDLTKLNDEEIEFLNGETKEFRRFSPLVLNGDYYRLTDTEKDFMAWELVSEDKSHALITAVRTKAFFNAKPILIKADGLKENAIYSVIVDGVKREKSLTGCALMKIGLILPDLREQYSACRIELAEE